MADLELLLEAEKRGILPADKQELLAEARNRGLVPPLESAGELPKNRNYAGELYHNILPSFSKFAQGLYQSVRHPLQTGDALSDMLAGLVLEATPEKFRKPGTEEKAQALEAAAQPVAESITKSIQNPAGIPKRALEYAVKDPFQALANLSMLTRGAGALTRSQTLGKAATALDPVNMAIKTTGAVARPLGYLGRQGFGFFTGQKFPNVNTLYQTFKKGGPTAEKMREYVRGDLEGADAYSAYAGALTKIRNNQLKEYTSHLKNIEGDVSTTIDLGPIKNKLTPKLYDYDIKVGPKGKLDFSRSGAIAVDVEAQQAITKAVDVVRGWGKQVGDTTPYGMDKLRQTLDGIYAPNSRAREFIASLKESVKDQIIEKVPEYKTMLKGFEKHQELFEDSKKLFSIKNPNDRRVNADLVLKKLQRAMKEDSDFGRNFIQTVEKESGTDIKTILAGYSMSAPLPGGIVGRGMLGGSLFEALRGGFARLDPSLALMMASASPRAVGEFLNVAAKVTRAAGTAKKGAIATTLPRQVLTQAGAVTEKKEE